MHFLQSPPPYLFFTGKGGVGKTSIACASALKLAEQGRSVLLVSTDPASNIAQVFEQDIGAQITPLKVHPSLFGLEIDPHIATEHYRQRIITPVRESLSHAELQQLTEQLSGACTTEIAAFDEFTSLLCNPEIRARFDHIIFDTAPTGHTIRLLQLPAAWSDFITADKGSASCLGPLAGLEKQAQQYQHVVNTLCDPLQTRMVLVARPQKTSLQEAARTHHELEALGIGHHYLVVNACMPKAEADNDELAEAIYLREQKQLDNISTLAISDNVLQVPLQAFNMVGPENLREFFRSCDENAEKGVSPQPQSVPELHHALGRTPPNELLALHDLVDQIEADQHGLIMTMGKGGVGKTTIAAAIAVELARRGHQVHLSSSDPAAHISDTIDVNNPQIAEHLSISRIDPQVETERYQAHVLASKSKKLTEEQLQLVKEDLASPCTQEIAVFHAFSRILREANKKFVVMDTAPTGHTLLLMDTTGAYHREIERQMQQHGMRFTTPLMQLQDRNQTKVILLSLAETTPILEALSLQKDLQRAGIQPWAWVINNSLAYSVTHSTLLNHRAQLERQEIQALLQQHPPRLSFVAMQKQDPVGELGLQRLL
ncbi:arsenical pump-driving ATPase [Undibacterium cyanobacteriorum]|uniref:Arsenical pump-driving ATPase n=1 Tax=Undibacterium cyanobacteriorum TaxID=3073561 RepID=A0ABY9RLF8_9BURK|nr:arsenical pump-driving ATPase [Undibacterium sp. 20NA77.5]WMW81534.1 arsenical pump-driving ATPase [Undibacterium sp. 20NA77.5]